MAPVFAKINHLDIEPLGANDDPPVTPATPLLEHVRRQAEVLRNQWLQEKMSGVQPDGNKNDESERQG
jgi:hypothetical protein